MQKNAVCLLFKLYEVDQIKLFEPNIKRVC